MFEFCQCVQRKSDACVAIQNGELFKLLIHQAQFLQPQNETQSSSQPTRLQQSAESPTLGNNKEKQKAMRERWSHYHTKVLIGMYVDKFDELEFSACTQMWPSIVEAVSSHGPETTLKQYKVKIRNMRDAYKKCKDENKKVETNQISFHFMMKLINCF